MMTSNVNSWSSSTRLIHCVSSGNDSSSSYTGMTTDSSGFIISSESWLWIPLLRKDTHDYGKKNTNEHGYNEAKYPKKAFGVLLYEIDLTIRRPSFLHLNSLRLIELIHNLRINEGSIDPLEK